MIRMLEGLSQILYHNTYINFCYEIVKSDEFKLTTNLGTGADKFTDKFYYLSMSRIKYGGYARSMAEEGLVNMVLDGRKLGQRYKGGPVDYWGIEFRSAAKGDQKLRNDENEERIFTDDPSIPNARKYILGIHINISGKPEGDEEEVSDFSILFNHRYSRELQNLRTMCGNFKIPFFIYVNNFKSFTVLDTRKAMEYKERTNYISALIDIYNNYSNIKDIPYEYPYKIFINGLSRADADYMDPELLTQLSSDIHNYRTHPEYRDLIAELTNIMRKERTRTLKDFLILLAGRLSDKNN